MSTQCFINSIYLATEGEGVHLGTPQIFVRFQGCNIGCVNCDSKDTWEFQDSSARPIEMVMAQIHAAGKVKRVSITGGDPLHPKILPGVMEVALRLKREGYYVSLEAAGTRIVDELFDLIDYVNFDFKTPSTGVKTSTDLIVKLAQKFPGKFQLKAVIADQADFHATVRAYEAVAEKVSMDFPWCLTPCYEPNEPLPLERFQQVVEMNQTQGAYFRVIGQQHKWLFGPDKKQV
ncbi:MAG: 7-carboxy-7-deazaguanine synthase QueE [Bacteriovoracaceae bacterium]|nr:7-carboxy-7-deazaguanine synthase QueE [Bacteriovoracaceae bacterium]